MQRHYSAMKMDSRIIILFLACSIMGMVSAADIKKCYKCNGKVGSCTQTEETCVAASVTPPPAGGETPGGETPPPPEGDAQSGNASSTAAPPAPAPPGFKRLVERDEAAAPAIKWKCLKITTNDSNQWRGCGQSCDDQPITHKPDECVACDDKDLCNLAIRINYSIGWIFTLIFIICCVGVRY